jgi:predicted RNase H-like nuclease
MSARHPARRLLGVDACRTGWVGVAPDPAGPRAYLAADIAALVAAAEADGAVAVVAIDIPIGLPDAGVRRADVLARAAVGRRAASVFRTPVRAAVAAADHATAVRVNRELAGEGVSAQAYGLRTKILDVDGWVRGQPRRVVEVHPEVSFAAMSGAPLPAPKRTWAGMRHRLALLARAGIALPDDLGPAGRLVPVDDMLDAAAAAWSARRVAAGTARRVPDPPEVFADGLPCAIWT